MRRTRAIAASLALACGVTAGSASAGLLPPLPGLPTTTTTTTTSSGTLGGVVDGVTGAIDGVLGAAPGSTDGTLSTGTLDGVLNTLLGDGSGSGSSGTGSGATGGSTSSGGTSGDSTASGGSTSSDGSASSGGSMAGGGSSAGTAGDTTAPRLGFKVLSRLRQIGRTGKLRLRVTTNEAAVVAFTSLIRPGRVRFARGRPLTVSRKLIRIKAIVLAFHRAGALKVTLRLPRSARGRLLRTRDARLALASWTSDLARNQARRNVRRTISR